MLRIVDATSRRTVRALLAPARTRDSATERRVATIVAAVRRDGDRALLRYARQFDPLDGPVEVTRAEMRAAAARVPRAVRAAIETAARNIRDIRLLVGLAQGLGRVTAAMAPFLGLSGGQR